MQSGMNYETDKNVASFIDKPEYILTNFLQQILFHIVTDILGEGEQNL
jgi:hypothetical protein